MPSNLFEKQFSEAPAPLVLGQEFSLKIAPYSGTTATTSYVVLLSPLRVSSEREGIKEGYRNVVVTGAAPNDPKLTVLRKSVNQLLDLTDDWDGYGSFAVRRLAIEKAFNFARRCIESCNSYTTGNYICDWQMPSVCPTPDGGVVLVWRVNGNARMVSIDDKSELVYLTESTEGQPARTRKVSEIDALKSAVSIMRRAIRS